MRTPFPEKILKMIDDMDAQGSVPQSRLMVLQKWFEKRPERIPAFGLWIARKASGRKGKTKGEAGALLDEARKLLGTTMFAHSPFEKIDPQAAACLCERAREIPDCRPLRLMEMGLSLHIAPDGTAEDACRLAIAWTQPRDVRSGPVLNGLSTGKLEELVRWLFSIEALEDWPSAHSAPVRKP